MNILGWIVVGFVAGALARFVAPGRYRMGCISTIVVGVLGGVVGGAAFQLATGEGIGDFGWRSIGIAFLGAFTLLILYTLFSRDRRSGSRR